MGESARFLTRPFPAWNSLEQLGGSIGALPGHWRIKMVALAARFRVFAEDRPGSVKRAGEFGGSICGVVGLQISSVSLPLISLDRPAGVRLLGCLATKSGFSGTAGRS